MSVSCECCVLSGRGLCDGLITRPEKSYRLWCVVVCDLETSSIRRPWPTGGCRAKRRRNSECMPIPVAEQSKAWVCGRSLAGIVGSNPTGGHGCLLFVVCCQLEVSVSGWSLVQRSPTECGVSECDRESLIMKRPWPTGGGRLLRRGNKQYESIGFKKYTIFL